MALKPESRPEYREVTSQDSAPSTPGLEVAAPTERSEEVSKPALWLLRHLRLQRLLYASLILVPATVVADVLGASDVPLFVLSVLALIPLAWLIGEATEQVGEYTGPAVAGLLNASFGNAPELIIALLAVHRGLFDVVRGSLTGSVISNLLLVLGFSLLVGGRGRIARKSVYVPLGMVALAALLFGVPGLASDSMAHERLTAVGIVVAVFLLTVYFVVTARSMVAERRRHRESGSTGDPDWSLRRALVTLALATGATVAMSEVLTASIEEFAHASGMSDLFVAAVIVAIAGNAAEHGGAVVIAARGGIRLASEIAFQSASQVAVGVIPAVVLLSLFIRPLPLFFSWTEYLGLAIAVAVPALLLMDGRSARWNGAGLLTTYAVLVVVFFVAV